MNKIAQQLITIASQFQDIDNEIEQVIVEEQKDDANIEELEDIATQLEDLAIQEEIKDIANELEEVDASYDDFVKAINKPTRQNVKNFQKSLSKSKK